jgi:beta-lactamase regulating signal transducer with metallopeptidase domain
MTPLLHTIFLSSAALVSRHISAIWQGAVLAACVALCLGLFPRLSSAAKSFVWMNVFLLLVLLQVLPALGGGQGGDSAFHRSAFHLDPRWSVAVAAIWAIFSLWRGTQLILSAIRLHRLARLATPVEPGAALEDLLRIGGNGNRSRLAQLCASVEVDRPCVLGFFQPRILLPTSLLERLTPLELRQVVLHEMEHLRRADDWTNLLQKAALVLFPLNPVLMWVERRLCAEREIACDDRVLNFTGARKSYAVCLTRLAEYSMLRRSLSLVLGAWERQSELAHRVHRILRQPGSSMSARQATVLTGGLVLAVLAGAIGLAHSPQLVSFTPLGEPSTAQASLMPAADFRQASFRGSATSPTLVKAVVEQRSLEPVHVANHRSAVSAAKRNVIRRPAPAPVRQQWFVLTQWNESEPPPRLVIAVDEYQRPSYAAIAVANGWLIVQI